MSTAIAVPPSKQRPKSELSLVELTNAVLREHERTRAAARRTIEHAIATGELLLQVRERTITSGEWTTWLHENFPLDRTTAYDYMRLATYQHLIPPGTSTTGAEKLLVGLPCIDGGASRERVSDVKREDAERLRREGRGYKAIAKTLEVSPSTVHAWFKGGTRKQRDKKARAALREKEKARVIRRAARKRGGAIAEAYSTVERLDDILGRARDESSSSEAKRELSRAHEFHHAMRDAIVKALGVEP